MLSICVRGLLYTPTTVSLLSHMSIVQDQLQHSSRDLFPPSAKEQQLTEEFLGGASVCDILHIPFSRSHVGLEMFAIRAKDCSDTSTKPSCVNWEPMQRDPGCHFLLDEIQPQIVDGVPQEKPTSAHDQAGLHKTDTRCYDWFCQLSWRTTHA
mmetsp:Transcript_28647/g.46410  ORF Transcript_28647/g.46410 Transcript_28647/m.46410 type:complete len:153 (-) Transcript_28647:146-604(-)